MPAPDGRWADMALRVTRAVHTGPDFEVDDAWQLVGPHDPAATDPFLVLTESVISSAGFDWHPHRGFASLTLVLGGALEHSDSRGTTALLRTGDAAWETMGGGVLHREMAAGGAPTRILQLWVALGGSDSTAPSYETVSPATGVLDHAAVTARLLTLAAAGSTVLPADPARRTFVACLDGAASATCDGDGDTSDGAAHELTHRQVAWRDPADGAVTLSSIRGARLLVCSAPPTGEPLLVRGSFVAADERGIAAAERAHRAGEFGAPGRERHPRPPRPDAGTVTQVST